MAYIENKQAVIGITDHAQKALHEIDYAKPPTVDPKSNGTNGTVESIRRPQSFYSNLRTYGRSQHKSENSPELLNDPYDKGWIAKVRSTNLKTT